MWTVRQTNLFALIPEQNPAAPVVSGENASKGPVSGLTGRSLFLKKDLAVSHVAFYKGAKHPQDGGGHLPKMGTKGWNEHA